MGVPSQPMEESTEFDRLIREALDQPFVGWDFAFVSGRIVEASPSWDYRSMVSSAIRQSDAMLDLCTGGGEFLNGFDLLPPKTVAAEGYAPNVKVARRLLEARGVEVVEFLSENALPLEGQVFDLIVNRHGAYSVREVKRLARGVGSRFVTQQVGSNNALEINRILGQAPGVSKEWTMSVATKTLEAQGFKILRATEEFPSMRFLDVGALVYYLKAIPWQVPEFDVNAQLHTLLSIHEGMQREGGLNVSAHRFIIDAELI